MKLTNITAEKAEQTWEVGDFFVRRGTSGNNVGVRRIVRLGGVYAVIAIDTNQVIPYPYADTAEAVMEQYVKVNGDVAKIEIQEIIFEEVAK